MSICPGYKSGLFEKGWILPKRPRFMEGQASMSDELPQAKLGGPRMSLAFCVPQCFCMLVVYGSVR